MIEVTMLAIHVIILSKIQSRIIIASESEINIFSIFPIYTLGVLNRKPPLQPPLGGKRRDQVKNIHINKKRYCKVANEKNRSQLSS